MAAKSAKNKKIVVCASGRGSNFRALWHAIAKEKVKQAEIIALLSDQENSPAAQFAREQKIDLAEIPFSQYSARSIFDAKVHTAFEKWQPDLILTLGYMRIIAPVSVNTYLGRIINIHPSLLPAFSGLRAQRQALRAGVRITGVTTHFVDNGLDTGPIIAQRAVMVHPDDDEESLSTRILQQEHDVLIETVALFCGDNLAIEKRKVIIQ